MPGLAALYLLCCLLIAWVLGMALRSLHMSAQAGILVVKVKKVE